MADIAPAEARVQPKGALADESVPELVAGGHRTVDGVQGKRKLFSYLASREFWIVITLGQVLSVCITSTNTLTTLLANAGTSIPAFQTLFNYVLLNVVYTGWTLHRYGPRKWARLVWRDGWRFFVLAFLDVEGNYFVVLAYRYTTILSAQLINFWAIVVVVVVSLLCLRVRYHATQYVGILLCLGGMGVLFASDHMTGNNQTAAVDAVKGDLFALLGATLYGLSNCFEEFLVSKRPVYEVLGQLAFWGMLINGVQAAIFDRASFRAATWNAPVAGYLVGYTLVLALFYSLAPVLFRLSSAAFFNISLLTGSFWGVAIGVDVFHYHIHWLYPIAFVLILVGHVLYYCTTRGILGESVKPWLQADQADGVAGIGTARRRVQNPAHIV